VLKGVTVKYPDEEKNEKKIFTGVLLRPPTLTHRLEIFDTVYDPEDIILSFNLKQNR